MELNEYSDPPANGDPVVVHLGREAVSLGTGFEGWEDVGAQVEYAIGEQAGKLARVYDGGPVHLFTVGATMAVDIETESEPTDDGLTEAGRKDRWIY